MRCGPFSHERWSTEGTRVVLRVEQQWVQLASLNLGFGFSMSSLERNDVGIGYVSAKVVGREASEEGFGRACCWSCTRRDDVTFCEAGSFGVLDEAFGIVMMGRRMDR